MGRPISSADSHPLILSEARQTVAHYQAMVRMNQWNVFSTIQTRHKIQHHYYSGTESDEDLVGNPPSVTSSWALSIRSRQWPEEAGGAEVMLLQGVFIIRLIWMRLHMILQCHPHAEQDILLWQREGPPMQMKKKDKKGWSAKPSLKNLSSLSDSRAYVQWKKA